LARLQPKVGYSLQLTDTAIPEGRGGYVKGGGRRGIIEGEQRGRNHNV